VNYLGRINALIFIIVSYLTMFTIARSSIILFQFIFIVLLCVVGWGLGKQYDKVNFLAEKDPLTEIYNRRFVFTILPSILEIMDKKNEKLCVFVLDIDDFKSINNTFGHEMGDKVIQTFSTLLLNSTMKADIVARWGGDEFLVIAPFSNQMRSMILLERIEKGQQQLFEKLGVKISVSMGTATYPDDAKNINDLISIADKRMYESKSKRKSKQ
jgi:diguanylate cyclase (GGDEF)-like protein